jgi:hypothetical protein
MHVVNGWIVFTSWKNWHLSWEILSYLLANIISCKIGKFFDSGKDAVFFFWGLFCMVFATVRVHWRGGSEM